MIYKTIKNGSYQTINNAVFVYPVSVEARCLLAYMLSKPADWQFYNGSICKEFGVTEGKLKKLLSELKTYGVVNKIRVQVKGRYEWITEVFESPELNTRGQKTIGSKSTDCISTDCKTPDILNTDINQVLTKQKNNIINPPTPEALLVAERLAVCIVDNYSFMAHKISPKDHARWAEDIEKLHRIDGYDYKLITAVADWSQQDNFWKQNIRSGATLRKQFTKLLVRIKSEQSQIEVIS